MPTDPEEPAGQGPSSSPNVWLLDVHCLIREEGPHADMLASNWRSWAAEGLVHFCCLCWVLEAVGRSLVLGQRWALPLVAMASGSRLALEAQRGGWGQI